MVGVLMKKFLDKSSIFHFLFGISLGILFGLIIESFIIAFLIGLVSILIAEYIFHKIYEGKAIFTTPNALFDLFLANLGLVMILIFFYLSRGKI